MTNPLLPEVFGRDTFDEDDDDDEDDGDETEAAAAAAFAAVKSLQRRERNFPFFNMTIMGAESFFEL